MLLGLDLGGKVGFALFRDDGTLVDTGTFIIRKGATPQDYGIRALHLAKWLDKFIRDYAVTRMAFEAPFLPINQFKKVGEQKTPFTQHGVRLGVVWATVAELIAVRASVTCVEVLVVEGKMALTGNHVAKKPEMVAAARARGWMVADEHQGDAAGVGLVDLVARGILEPAPRKVRPKKRAT